MKTHATMIKHVHVAVKVTYFTLLSHTSPPNYDTVSDIPDDGTASNKTLFYPLIMTQYLIQHYFNPTMFKGFPQCLRVCV